MIILEVTKSQSFTVSLQNKILERPEGGRVKLIPSPVFLGLNYLDVFVCGNLKQIKIYLTVSIVLFWSFYLPAIAMNTIT